MPKKLDFLFFIGRPFGPFYGTIMKIRELAYKQNIFRMTKLSIPVISVGNLVLGGTGKSPIVIHIARLLQQKGYRPCVVSRGYRGTSKAPYNVVSNGSRILKSTIEVGDEAVMVAKKLPGIPVLTGKQRRIPCAYAEKELGVNAVILDDGFQHMAVARNIDITLFDSTSLAGNSRIFPGGPLREPVSALRRSSAFLMTGQNRDNSARSQAFSELLQQRFPGKQVYFSQYSRPYIVDSENRPVAETDIGPCFLFCGIGNPERFTKSVQEIGLEIIGEKPLDDHASYSQNFFDEICKEAEAAGASHLLTTAKDFVKLENFTSPIPLLILHVEQQPQPEFDQFILESLHNLSLAP